MNERRCRLGDASLDGSMAIRECCCLSLAAACLLMLGAICANNASSSSCRLGTTVNGFDAANCCQ